MSEITTQELIQICQLDNWQEPLKEKAQELLLARMTPAVGTMNPMQGNSWISVCRLCDDLGMRHSDTESETGEECVLNFIRGLSEQSKAAETKAVAYDAAMQQARSMGYKFDDLVEWAQHTQVIIKAEHTRGDCFEQAWKEEAHLRQTAEADTARLDWLQASHSRLVSLGLAGGKTLQVVPECATQDKTVREVIDVAMRAAQEGAQAE